MACFKNSCVIVLSVPLDMENVMLCSPLEAFLESGRRAHTFSQTQARRLVAWRQKKGASLYGYSLIAPYLLFF